MVVDALQRGVAEQAHAVATLALGLVERVVGRREQLVGGAHAGVEGGHAAAHRQVFPVLLARVHGAPHAVGEHDRPLGVRPGQDAHELLAAEAPGQVHPARGAGEDVGEDAERLVSGLMAEAVVERLEAVQVEQHHRKQPTALRRGELVLQEDPGVAAVGEVGEDVGEGHVLHLVAVAVQPIRQPADRERDGDLGHHHPEQEVGDAQPHGGGGRLRERQGRHPPGERGRHTPPAAVVREQKGRHQRE